MDTSETYIEMCWKAAEIQAHWKAAEGDFFFLDFETKRPDGSTNIMVLGCHWEQCAGCEHEAGEGTWLPRQDQLQEMVEPKDRRIHEWLGEFAEFAMAQPRTIPNAFDTTERLLLKFVMKEKFNKSWNGEDWVVNSLS